jgi:hypothetical protein
MTDPSLLFREEALRGREAPPPPGGAARANPRWITGAYWALLALVAGGLTVGALIRVGEVAQGPAVVRGAGVEAVVPAVFAADLHSGMPLKLMLPRRPPVTVLVTATGPEVAGAVAASSLLGTAVAGVGPAPGPLLLVRATAPPGVAEGAAGTASVQVGSQRLIVTLVKGLVSDAGDG